MYTLYHIGYGQGNDSHLREIKTLENDHDITIHQIITDTLFNSKQSITRLFVPKTGAFAIKFSHANATLRPTSMHGKSKKAIAAINGGFFNMKKGWSVTYFEMNDTIISISKVPKLKRLSSTYIFNGAIVITDDYRLTIEPVRSDKFYEISKKEAAVLVSGPLLISHSKIMDMPNIDFVNKRHPRTCLCTTKKSIVFITIDGRSNTAEGMNLHEVQRFLIDMGCVDAINLDGGGSTTMWVNDKGILNFPSDASGERPVSNAILVVKRKHK